MAEAKRATRKKRSQREMQALMVEEAFSTWIPPTIGVVLLAVAMLLDALEVVSEPVAALLAVVALLILGAYAALSPMIGGNEAPKVQPLLLGGLALAWIAIFTVPFLLRLFPGPPLVSAALEPNHTGNTFTLGDGRFDLVVDAHLPMSIEHQNRELSYAVTLTDGSGEAHRFDGELGDRWQTRRLGRRGTAPVHLEHLSTTHQIDHPSGGSLRVDEVTLSGVPNATLSGSFYRRRLPDALLLLAGGILIGLAALAFDFWSDPRRTPTAALVTATATGAVLVFCSSAAGHPGLRQVLGSAIVGGIGGVPTAGVVGWLARRSSWTRALLSQRAS